MSMFAAGWCFATGLFFLIDENLVWGVLNVSLGLLNLWMAAR
jgi:hypothetical protein